MTVQIKLLKGFRNFVNNERNTLSLLVKSDLVLRKHLLHAYEKILTSLTSILENFDSNFVIFFYHKLSVIYENKMEYLRTKDYHTDLGQLIGNLDSSIEEVIKMTYGKFNSHFINVTIKMNDGYDVYELSPEEFKILNFKHRTALSKMNEEEDLFNDVVEQIKKKVKNNSKIKKATDKPLFIDDDYDVKPIKKKNKCSVDILDGSATLTIETLPIKNDDSLFIDDYDVKPIKKSNNVKPIKKSNNVKPIKKSNNVKPIKKSNNVKPINDDSLFI